MGQSSPNDSENCRKNIKSLINSFISAFDKAENKPALILKTSASNVSVSDYFATRKILKKSKKNIQVKLNLTFIYYTETSTQVN